MNCQWPSLKKGTRCINCGLKLPRDVKRAPICVCQPRTNRTESKPTEVWTPPGVCIHQGDMIGKVKTCCGQNNIHTVHRCTIHKRCVPTFAGPWDANHQIEAKLYHLCGADNCADYQT